MQELNKDKDWSFLEEEFLSKPGHRFQQKHNSDLCPDHPRALKQTPLWRVLVCSCTHIPAPSNRSASSCSADMPPHSLPAAQYARLKLKPPFISLFINNSRFWLPSFFFISPTLFGCRLTLPSFPIWEQRELCFNYQTPFHTHGWRQTHFRRIPPFCFFSLMKLSAPKLPPPLTCKGFCPRSWSPPDDWQIQSSISAYAKLKQCLLKKKKKTCRRWEKLCAGKEGTESARVELSASSSF